MATSVSVRVLPLREISLVGLVTAALFLLLAIGSYTPTDPSFSFSGHGARPENLVGISGAYFADLVLYLFGWVAYVIPIALTIAGLRSVFGVPATSHWLLLCIRTSGWLAVVVSACVLLHLHSSLHSSLPAGTGGIFGQWLAENGAAVFGWVGLTVLAVAGALIGVQAAAGFSWLDVAESTGRNLYRCSHLALEWYDRSRERWAKRREARREAKVVARSNVQARREALAKRKDIEAERSRKAIVHPKLKSGSSTSNAAKGAVKILPTAQEKRKSQQKRLFDTQVHFGIARSRSTR